MSSSSHNRRTTNTPFNRVVQPLFQMWLERVLQLRCFIAKWVSQDCLHTNTQNLLNIRNLFQLCDDISRSWIFPSEKLQNLIDVGYASSWRALSDRFENHKHNAELNNIIDCTHLHMSWKPYHMMTKWIRIDINIKCVLGASYPILCYPKHLFACQVNYQTTCSKANKWKFKNKIISRINVRQTYWGHVDQCNEEGSSYDVKPLVLNLAVFSTPS